MILSIATETAQESSFSALESTQVRTLFSSGIYDVKDFICWMLSVSSTSEMEDMLFIFRTLKDSIRREITEPEVWKILLNRNIPAYIKEALIENESIFDEVVASPETPIYYEAYVCLHTQSYYSFYIDEIENAIGAVVAIDAILGDIYDNDVLKHTAYRLITERGVSTIDKLSELMGTETDKVKELLLDMVRHINNNPTSMWSYLSAKSKVQLLANNIHNMKEFASAIEESGSCDGYCGEILYAYLRASNNWAPIYMNKEVHKIVLQHFGLALNSEFVNDEVFRLLRMRTLQDIVVDAGACTLAKIKALLSCERSLADNTLRPEEVDLFRACRTGKEWALIKNIEESEAYVRLEYIYKALCEAL